MLIKVSDETRRELKRLKRGNENYDQVIRKLIRSYVSGGRVVEV